MILQGRSNLMRVFSPIDRTSAAVLGMCLALAPVRAAVAAPPEEPAPAADASAPADAAAPAEGEPPTEGAAPAETKDVDVGLGVTPPAEAASPAEEGAADDADATAGSEAPADDDVGSTTIPLPTDGEMDDFSDLGKDAEPRVANGKYAATGKGLLIAGGVTTGVGAAFLGTAIAVTACEYGSNLDCRFGQDRDFLVPMAIAVTSLGALLLIGGGVQKARYDRWKKKSGSSARVRVEGVAPGMMRDGAGVFAVGRF